MTRPVIEHLRWLVLLAALSGCAAAPDRATRMMAAIADMKRSVVPVVCTEMQLQLGGVRVLSVEGTGFFVHADGRFLTAAHVIDAMAGERVPDRPCPVAAIYVVSWAEVPDAATVRVDYFRFDTRDCQRDAETDLALCRPVNDLARSGFPPRPVTFAEETVGDGTPVAFTGFPLSRPTPFSAMGQVAAHDVVVNGKGPAEVYLDRPAWPGSSGSPAFLDDRRVVGVVLKTGVNQAAGLTRACSARAARTFLSGLGIGAQPHD